MKVRLGDQRIVFRLNENEKKELIEKGEKGISLNLGDQSLKFTLILSSSIDSLRLVSDQKNVQILLPLNYMDSWDEQKIGFEENLTFSDGNVLTIIIEKDLKRSKVRKV